MVPRIAAVRRRGRGGAMFSIGLMEIAAFLVGLGIITLLAMFIARMIKRE
jgi:hypothetical protein